MSKRVILTAIAALFIFGVLLVRAPQSKRPELSSNSPTPTALATAQPQVEGLSTQANDLGIKPQTFSVLRVVDGDTIKVLVRDQEETVRLIGLDTPETVDPRKPVQCFGKEASDKLKSVLDGKAVVLEFDPSQGERDKYDRLLRYVFLEDGTNVNALMIAEGYGHEYTYSTPYKYQDEFKQAEATAREGKRGLWADDACPS